MSDYNELLRVKVFGADALHVILAAAKATR